MFLELTFAAVCPATYLYGSISLHCESTQTPAQSQHSITHSRSHLHLVALSKEQIVGAANGLNNII